MEDKADMSIVSEAEIEVDKIAEETTAKRLLTFAAFNREREQMPVWGSSGITPEKMQVSGKYEDQVVLSRFFVERDPIAAGVVNKQVDVGFNGFRPRRGLCTDEEFEVYSSFSDVILPALKMMATEYLISGLLVPEIGWRKVTGGDLNIRSRRNKTYTVPEYIWLRDPLTIKLSRTPVPTKVRVFIRIPDEDVYFILNEGKFSDGTSDVPLYRQLVRDYPDYVKRVRNKETEILLENAFVIRRNITTKSIYPTPYLLPALESLVHKRNLKKMDYSIAARVISAIQKVTLGSDKFPLTEDDQQDIEELKQQMQWRNQPGNVERVFQIFGNHTLEIEWIYPDTAALLDSSKYNAVDNDILHALGMPLILISGETQRSATSQAEFALLPPTEVLRHLRDELLPFVKHLYEEVKKRNNFQHVAIPAMPPIRLYDPAKLAAIGEKYYINGALSKTTWDDLAGFDLENELINRKAEDALYEELGIEPQPQVPFSSPQIGQNGGNPAAPKAKTAKPTAKPANNS